MAVNFKDSKKGYIPNYTGHIPTQYLEEQPIVSREPKKQIPGYVGFVPGIKAENMFGKTYGKTTFKSSTGEFNRGLDLPQEKKFVSMNAKEFVDQKRVLYETAAKIVGVDKREDIYKRPINPNTVNKFWGIDRVEDDVVNQVGLEESKKAFYSSDANFSATEIARRE